jgi:hypothetical protein
MREIRQSGSEGGGPSLRSPYPYRIGAHTFADAAIITHLSQQTLGIRGARTPCQEP